MARYTLEWQIVCQTWMNDREESGSLGNPNVYVYLRLGNGKTHNPCGPFTCDQNALTRFGRMYRQGEKTDLVFHNGKDDSALYVEAETDGAVHIIIWGGMWAAFHATPVGTQCSGDTRNSETMLSSEGITKLLNLLTKLTKNCL